MQYYIKFVAFVFVRCYTKKKDIKVAFVPLKCSYIAHAFNCYIKSTLYSITNADNCDIIMYINYMFVCMQVYKY